MNLIPNKPGTTPNYYCTWEAQNNIDDPKRGLYHEQLEGQEGAKLARYSLNDDIVFGEDGLALQYEKAREDLYFVLDDGWDVPLDVHSDTQRHEFGSLLLNEERFPSCSGSPEVRLAKMNERIKSLGWKGVGLWVASQAQGEPARGVLSNNQAIEYWTQRLEWCRFAKIEYWKVDWGHHADSIEFRQMLTDLGKKIYPELLIEHCRCMSPTNNSPDGRFVNWEPDVSKAIETLAISDVLRSYDVTGQLAVATTLDRLAVLLQGKVKSGLRGIINCEDELYLGAALGCAFGVMRTKRNKIHKKFDEVTRASKWQRIAPAFGVTESTVYIGGDIGFDSWYFKPGDSWAVELTHTEVKQGAPIAISRGLPLPRFDGVGNEAPFVVAAKNPNGATSIATLPRAFKSYTETPLCNISLDVGGIDHPVGIFGHYGQLTLNFDHDINDKSIFAQDLAGDEARDITRMVAVNNNQLTITGDVIAKIGLSCASAGDPSDPGLVLVVR